jgi:Na+/H+-dicarboxylate symporter
MAVTTTLHRLRIMVKSLLRFKAYYFPALLITSVFAGGFTGYMLGHNARVLKPLGDIFLNLIFTAVVPLVFFSIAASVARAGNTSRLGTLLSRMFVTFVFTGMVAAMFMLVIVKLLPPAQDIYIPLAASVKPEAINLGNQITGAISVADFGKLFSHNNMLPLIIFSLLTGMATVMTKAKSDAFSRFLESGADVFMQLVNLIMYLAPIGFFSYFAVLVGDTGPQLLQTYLRVMLIYYFSATAYFVLAFTFYAYLAGGRHSITLFWKHILVPALTALATCSSAASIPANLQAAKKMNVPAAIYESVIPLGATLHKDGSVLGAIVKIAFLFGVFHLSFAGPAVMLTALLVALLAGTVMGAIPGGGMLGEMLILSLYGFPPQALIIIAAISIIIDPLATMLNVTGDAVCCLMTEKLMGKSITGNVDIPAIPPEMSTDPDMT